MQTSTTPAQIPEQFSNVFGLGAPLEFYRVGAANKWVSAILGFILLGGSGLVAIYGIYDTYAQVSKYGPVMLWKTIVPPLIIAGFLFLLGLLSAVNAYQNWNRAAVLYDKGLAYTDNKGLQTWNWPEVEWLYVAITKHYTNGIYTGTTYVYTLQKTDGSRLSLDNKFKKVEVLGAFINKSVTPFQYDRLVQRLRSGQTVILGPVAISKENIIMNKKTYPWSDVDSVAIRNGYVSIKKKNGEWFSGTSAPVRSIPNLDAFLSVVDQIVKIKTG